MGGRQCGKRRPQGGGHSTGLTASACAASCCVAWAEGGGGKTSGRSSRGEASGRGAAWEVEHEALRQAAGRQRGGMRGGKFLSRIWCGALDLMRRWGDVLHFMATSEPQKCLPK